MILEDEIKNLIISSLGLEDITIDDIKNDEPLFGTGLGLDSIDALEFGMALRKKYNIVLDEDKEVNKQYFSSVNTLAALIRSQANDK
ncbi:MAG: phosphopantetheine-binding protein [Candidatus Gastranaerophilaceae bacterium]